MIGCDGIFDRLTNSDVVNCIWDAATDLVSPNNKLEQFSPKVKKQMLPDK